MFREMKEEKSFHSLDLGDEVTPGRFSNWSPQNYPLYGALKLIEDFDLKNSVCLDIGTMDGLMAFSLKQAGAKEVLATDMAFRETFVYAREKLGLDIVYEFRKRHVTRLLTAS